jgi:hypothetical protein
MTVYHTQANTAKVEYVHVFRKCLILTTFGKDRFSQRRNLELCGSYSRQSLNEGNSILICRLKDTLPAGVTFTPADDSMDDLIEDYIVGLVSLLPGLSASPDSVVFKIFYPLFFKLA